MVMRWVIVLTLSVLLAECGDITGLVDAELYKQLLAEKLCNHGLVFVGPSDVVKGTKCLEEYLYDEYELEQLSDPGMVCVVKAVPLFSYLTAVSLLNSMNACVSPLDTFDVLNKIVPAISKIGQKAYDLVMDKIKKAKSYGKDYDYVMNEAYKKAAAVFTQPLVEQICTKMVPMLTKVEWDCVRGVGSKVYNLSQYACYHLEVAE